MRDTLELAREAGIYHAFDSEGHWDGLTDVKLINRNSHPADIVYGDKRTVEILKVFEALVRADAIADERSGAEERCNALLDDYCTAIETIGDMRSEDEVKGNIIECHEATIKRLEAKILAEREKFKHNEEVLMNALWKACGDDGQLVVETIASQGELK